jgi:hypothetical protein
MYLTACWIHLYSSFILYHIYVKLNTFLPIIALHRVPFANLSDIHPHTNADCRMFASSYWRLHISCRQARETLPSEKLSNGHGECWCRQTAAAYKKGIPYTKNHVWLWRRVESLSQGLCFSPFGISRYKIYLPTSVTLTQHVATILHDFSK